MPDARIVPTFWEHPILGQILTSLTHPASPTSGSNPITTPPNTLLLDAPGLSTVYRLLHYNKSVCYLQVFLGIFGYWSFKWIWSFMWIISFDPYKNLIYFILLILYYIKHYYIKICSFIGYISLGWLRSLPKVCKGQNGFYATNPTKIMPWDKSDGQHTWLYPRRKQANQKHIPARI